MKKITAVIASLFLLSTVVFGQNEKEGFKPNGKVFVRVFTNVHTTLNNGNSTPAFELERAYLGYDFNLSEQFSGKINIDMGNPGNSSAFEMTAYIKNAFLSYTNKKFTASFGMIPTTQFELQEKFWGNRYVEKVFQDDYKLGSSADLGLRAGYSITNWLNATLIAVNGEGYKKLQADKYFKTGLGVTLTPVKKLSAFAYYDLMGKDSTQSTFASFIGYDFGKASIGAEYNLQKNVGYKTGKDLSGVSVYASVTPVTNFKIYARYDYLTSNTLAGKTSNWNDAKDGNLILAGVEFQPVKGVKISPNYRLWNPADSSKKPTNSFYLSCDIKF
jgi:hypothetical protein